MFPVTLASFHLVTPASFHLVTPASFHLVTPAIIEQGSTFFYSLQSEKVIFQDRFRKKTKMPFGAESLTFRVEALFPAPIPNARKFSDQGFYSNASIFRQGLFHSFILLSPLRITSFPLNTQPLLSILIMQDQTLSDPLDVTPETSVTSHRVNSPMQNTRCRHQNNHSIPVIQ